MFELAYGDPDVQHIVAKYEDIAAQHQSAIDQIDTECIEQQAAIEKEVREQEEAVREFYEELAAKQAEQEAAKQAEQESAPDPAAKNPWLSAQPHRPKHFSFGMDDDSGAANIPAPQPTSAAAGPGAAQPWSNGAASEPDDEEAASSAPPRRPATGPRRAPGRPVTDNDDDDFSNQSWLR